VVQTNRPKAESETVGEVISTDDNVGPDNKIVMGNDHDLLSDDVTNSADDTVVTIPTEGEVNSADDKMG